MLSDDEMRLDETNDEESEFAFINEDSLKYMKKQANAGQNIRIERIDAYDFMMLDLDMLNNPDEEGESERGDYHAESLVDIARLQELSKEEEESRYEQRKQDFLAKYDEMDLFSVYASEFISDSRRQVIKELSQGKNKADDRTILKIVDPRISEEEMREKKRIWEEMCMIKF